MGDWGVWNRTFSNIGDLVKEYIVNKRREEELVTLANMFKKGRTDINKAYQPETTTYLPTQPVDAIGAATSGQGDTVGAVTGRTDIMPKVNIPRGSVPSTTQMQGFTPPNVSADQASQIQAQKPIPTDISKLRTETKPVDYREAELKTSNAIIDYLIGTAGLSHVPEEQKKAYSEALKIGAETNAPVQEEQKVIGDWVFNVDRYTKKIDYSSGKNLGKVTSKLGAQTKIVAAKDGKDINGQDYKEGDIINIAMDETTYPPKQIVLGKAPDKMSKYQQAQLGIAKARLAIDKQNKQTTDDEKTQQAQDLYDSLLSSWDENAQAYVLIQPNTGRKIRFKTDKRIEAYAASQVTKLKPPGKINIWKIKRGEAKPKDKSQTISDEDVIKQYADEYEKGIATGHDKNTVIQKIREHYGVK